MELIADTFTLILFFFFFPSPNKAIPAAGTVRLWRNGITNRAFASGRVQVAGLFDGHRWANICGNRQHFDQSAAEVICHQLGYSIALRFSQVATDGFGADLFPLVFLTQNCNAGYLTIGQCLTRVLDSSDCVKGVDDVSVVCMVTSIWSSPYDGMVRLVEGNYSSEGQLEVYCNGQWGTVCISEQFEMATASVVCKQLGYTGVFSYTRQLNQEFKPARPISDCASSSTCLQNCGVCSPSHMQVLSCSTIFSLIRCENEGLPVLTTNSTCMMIDAVNDTASTASAVTTGASIASAGIIFFIIVLIFILTAIFYRKKQREQHLEAIYEPIDLPSVPPLPPRLPHQIPMEPNPSYVQVDLIVNDAYKSIKDDTVINSASGALMISVSYEEEKCGDDVTTGGYEEVATEVTEADDDRSYVELRTADDSLPLPKIVSDYDKLQLASAVLPKSTLNPVRTAVSATNLTFDGDVQEGKSCLMKARMKKTSRNAHSATDIPSMGDHDRPTWLLSTDNSH